MNKTEELAIPLVLCFVAGFLMVVSFCGACGSAQPTPMQQATVALDAEEQRECVTNADAGVGKTALRSEIDACRAAIRARRDGGK